MKRLFGGPRFRAASGCESRAKSRGSATLRGAIALGLLLFVVSAPAQEPPKRPVLTDEQKAQMAQRADEAWSKLSPEAKAQVMRLHSALTQMPPEERKFIHDRVERFLNMSPEEREQLRKNAERFRNMSPEEREQARQQFRQRRKEFEEKWHQEHPGQEPPFPPRVHRPPAPGNTNAPALPPSPNP